MLSITDLNIIVKFYAFNLPQRIEQLGQIYPTYISTDQEDHQLQLLTLIDRFRGYKTKDEREVRLAKKLVERVMQIFDFFKGKSSNQNLLTIIRDKINRQLEGLISKEIDLGELFSFIHLIAKKGGFIRVPAEKRRVSSKSLLKQPFNFKIIPTTNRNQHIQQRGNSYNNHNNNNSNLMHNNYMNAPTTNSIQHKHVKSSSLSLHTQKWKIEQLMAGPFNCLDIEKTSFTRIRESNKYQIQKQMLRRNDKIITQMRKQQKRWKAIHQHSRTELSQDHRDSTILKEMKSNSLKGNNWMAKRKKPTVLPRKRQATLKQNMTIFI